MIVRDRSERLRAGALESGVVIMYGVSVTEYGAPDVRWGVQYLVCDKNLCNPPFTHINR